MLRLVLTGSHKPSAGFPVEELPAFAKIAPFLPPLGSLRQKGDGGWDVRMSTLAVCSRKP